MKGRERIAGRNGDKEGGEGEGGRLAGRNGDKEGGRERGKEGRKGSLTARY